jgi:hypothetical protein
MLIAEENELLGRVERNSVSVHVRLHDEAVE